MYLLVLEGTKYIAFFATLEVGYSIHCALIEHPPETIVCSGSQNLVRGEKHPAECTAFILLRFAFLLQNFKLLNRRAVNGKITETAASASDALAHTHTLGQVTDTVLQQ